MKEALLHMLFVGVVLFAASYLKKDNTRNTTTGLATQVQTSIDSSFQRKADAASALALVRDTIKLPRRK